MLKVDESRYVSELTGVKLADVNGNEDDLYSKKKSSVFGNSRSDNSKVESSVFEDSVISESDTKALGHQIAGHSRIGILKHKLGYVLKPLQKEPLGSREVEFYKKVFNGMASGEPLQTHLSSLQTLIPKFNGLKRMQFKNEGNDDQPVWKEYLAVDDIIEGFTRPCVLDIKIGAQTWDPDAPPKKIEHEKSKYKGTKVPLGLSLTGMQYFDLNVQAISKVDDGFGKTIDKQGLVDALEKFMNRAYDDQIPEIIAKKFVERLKDFQEYFAVQREFRFYASSLLVAYDAEKFANLRNCSSTLSCNGSVEHQNDVSSWLRVLMIDFAHVFPAENDEPDSNFVFGLGNLIDIFQGITSKHTNM